MREDPVSPEFKIPRLGFCQHGREEELGQRQSALPGAGAGAPSSTGGTCDRRKEIAHRACRAHRERLARRRAATARQRRANPRYFPVLPPLPQTLTRVRSLPIAAIAAAAVKKPASKGKIKMSGAKKKPKKAKKAKKPAKKAPSGPVKAKKVYDLPGQKKDPPEEGDSLRKFYVSLRKQIPESVMAEQWLVEHGLLPADEAAKAYKKFLIRKGRDPKKKKAGGSSGSKPSKPKPKPNPAVKKEPKAPVAKKASGIKRKALDDDDSDSDIPLAALKSNGGGGGFKIPKKE